MYVIKRLQNNNKKEKEKRIMKVIKRIFEVIMFVFGFDGEIRKKAVENGLCDFSGQGRNKYGK